jgi:superfamily II DNA/RNA helicase
VLFVGGTDKLESIQLYEEKGAQIVIATPGRLLEIMNHKDKHENSLTFKKLEVRRVFYFVKMNVCGSISRMFSV